MTDSVNDKYINAYVEYGKCTSIDGNIGMDYISTIIPADELRDRNNTGFYLFTAFELNDINFLKKLALTDYPIAIAADEYEAQELLNKKIEEQTAKYRSTESLLPLLYSPHYLIHFISILENEIIEHSELTSVNLNPVESSNPKPHWMMNNLVGVDKGALKMVENIMERAGKTEPMTELNATYTEIEDVLKWYAEHKPAEYMKHVTDEMMILYT